jgi:hypothetical protein
MGKLKEYQKLQGLFYSHGIIWVPWEFKFPNGKSVHMGHDTFPLGIS